MSAAKKIDMSEVSTELVSPKQNFLLKIAAKDSAMDPVKWMAENKDWVETQLIEHGAILLRNFKTDSPIFEKTIYSLSPVGSALDYEGGVSPRQKVSNQIYTSTIAPPESIINQHHEMCYLRLWPRKISFFCSIAPNVDGETPVTSARHYMKLLDPTIVKKFREKEVMYVRNYVLGPNWKQSYETEDKSKIEAYFKKFGIKHEWRSNDNLRTIHTAQGTAFHPVTKEEIFFNSALNLGWNSNVPGVQSPTLKLVTNACPPAIATVLANTPPMEMPYSTFFGDGSPIELSILEELQEIYNKEMVKFSWQQGDILVCENMLSTHGRNSFSGPRMILTMITEKYEPA